MSSPSPSVHHARRPGSQSACRVEKPRSHHSSPRVLTERRKTTTEAKLYATLDDHFKMMFGMAPDEAVEERSTRPLSWHPPSSQAPPVSQTLNHFEPMPQSDYSRHYSASPQYSNRQSDFYPLPNYPSTHELASAASSSYNPPIHGLYRGSNDSEYSWQDLSHHTPGYVHSALHTPVTEPLPWYLQQWTQQNQAQVWPDVHDESTLSPSIQHAVEREEETEEEEEEEEEKLVALGLYDAPESPPPWPASVRAIGKGLKLEETWQPPEQEEDDEAEADDASSEASVEVLSPPLPQAGQRLHIPVTEKAQLSGDLVGRSFFFDEDETASKGWWFPPSKQTPVHMPATGLAYRWI